MISTDKSLKLYKSKVEMKKSLIVQGDKNFCGVIQRKKHTDWVINQINSGFIFFSHVKTMEAVKVVITNRLCL